MSLKNFIKKSIATTMTASILLGNCSLCGLGISKVIAEDANTPEIVTHLKNQKYVQYTEGDISGIAVHSTLDVYTNQEKDTYLPTEEVEIALELPSINGVLPERALVVEAKTKSTTGEELNTKINQNYDSDSGLLTVDYENIPNEEKNIYSEYIQGAKDELEIIYTYPAGACTESEEVKLEYSVDTKMTFKTENGTVLSQDNENIELVENENRGEISTFGVTELKENIYKGFMYSNVNNKSNYDTEFNTVSTFAVLNSLVTDETVIELKESKFILKDKEKTQISTDANVVYKSTGISKYEFDKILGTDGHIEFCKGEDVIATVKYVEVEDDNKFAVISSDGKINVVENDKATVQNLEELNSLKISKPITEGFIHFENQNVIKASSDYGCKVKDINSILVNAKINENVSNTEILLLEPETKISVNSSNTNFSTLQNNKTTLTISLDDTNSSTKLFNNPTIIVTLPEGIVRANVSSPRIVNGNGLEIESATAKGNVITINLKGKQTSYDLKNVSGGVSIVMDLENIDYKDTMPTQAGKIEVNCIQKNETVETSCNVNIVSKAGLLMLTKLSNYDESGNVLTVIDGNINTVEVANNAETREVVYTLDLVNNYDDKLTNVEILGQLNYSNNEIKSTFDLALINSIQVNDETAKVYYSTENDNWTEEYTESAKAFKIVLSNNELAKADSKEIKAFIKVPGNLGFNQENYLSCNVSYEYNENKLQDNSIVGITTSKSALETYSIQTAQKVETNNGEIPVRLSVTPILTQDYVHSGQLVTYKIRVTNDGEETLNNLVVKDIIPDNAIYTYYAEREGVMANYLELVKEENTKQKEWKINLLKPGDIAEIKIMLTMSDVTEEQEVINKIILSISGQDIETESKLQLKPSVINTKLTTNTENKVNVIYRAEDTISYYISIKNMTQKNMKNIKVEFNIPEEYIYLEGGLYSYDESEGNRIEENGTVNNNVFEYNINKLAINEEKHVIVNVKIRHFKDKAEETIINSAKIYINDEIYETNIKTATIKQAIYEVKQTVDTKGKEVLQKDDEVVYTINVKNIGKNLGSINILDNIPEQLKVLKLEYIVNNNTDNAFSMETSNQNIEIINYLDKDDILTIKITAKVKDIEVEEDTIIKSINKATLTSGELTIDSNEVTINVKPELKIVEDKIEEDNTVEENNSNINNPENIVDDNINNKEEDNTDEEDSEGIVDNNVNNKEENYENLDSDNNNDDTEDKEDNNNTEDNKEDNNDNTEDNKDNNNNDTENKDNTEDKENDNNEENVDKEENNTDNENQEPVSYTISGIAWIDENKDGKRDENEKVQDNLTVSLVNKDIGNFAIDSNGNRIKTTTDNTGKYTFNNIPKGNYLVLFEFDTNTYTVSTYQKTDIEANLNSDAIVTTVTIDGVKKLAAVTDTIVLDSNKENIDLGLMQNAIFDLSLEKQITKITVKNSKGTEVTEYEDGETAKVDLVAKYMNGSQVIVNYKFTIKNEGEVTGYVDSLVTELPSGLEFDSESNQDWYKGQDGKLYTTALSGKAIKPNENTEIELVLTKTMTEDSTGIFASNAILEKISNLENIQEKEEAKENNQSSAMLIISIKTGTVIMYIGLTLLCASIILAGTYLIKKKVLSREI